MTSPSHSLPASSLYSSQSFGSMPALYGSSPSFVFCHQSYTVFIALPVSTPMVRADNKFACCLDVFLSITQTKIDSSLSIYIVLLAVFRINAVTFIIFNLISGLNTAKLANCSQIVPNYPEIISISLNLIRFNAVCKSFIYR